MYAWIVVIGLLALAVLFLFISLFLKDNDYEEEMDELSDSLLEVNREIYFLKKKIQELEGTSKVTYAKDEVPVSDTNNDTKVFVAPEQVTPQVSQEPAVAAPEVEEATPKKIHNITKQHIITLYSHGLATEEIAEQLNVPVTTVKLIVENYFENDAK